MVAFHEAHFSKLATEHFQSNFLRPGPPAPEETTCDETYEEYYDEEEEDDGLGYYPDGVKRTLSQN